MNIRLLISIIVFLIIGQVAFAQLRQNMGLANAGSIVKIIGSWSKDTATTITDSSGKMV